MGSIFRLFLYLGGLLLLFLMLGNGFHVVSHGQVGVVLVNVGDQPVLETLLEPGWYWRRPFVVQVQSFPTTMLSHSVTAKVVDRNHREFNLAYRVDYALDKGKIVKLFKTFGPHYSLQEVVRQRLDAVVTRAMVSAQRDDVYKDRDVQGKALKEACIGRVPEGVAVHEFTITNIEYPEDHKAALAQLPVRAALENYDLSGLTEEKRTLSVGLSVQFRVVPQSIETVIDTLGVDFRKTLLEPTVKAVALACLAERKADEVFTPAGREAYAQAVQQRIRQKLEGRGFAVEDVMLQRMSFEPALMRQIEELEQEKVALTRMGVRRQQVVRESEIEAFKTREALKLRVETADTDAQVRLKEAESQKTAAIARAQGDKEALHGMSELLTSNPRLLDYLSISRLSDKVQVIVAPPGAQGMGMLAPRLATPETPAGR